MELVVCSIPNCRRRFHWKKECCGLNESDITLEYYVCPCHVCAYCGIRENPQNPLTKCFVCTKAYHQACLPRDAIRLDAKYFKCASHYNVFFGVAVNNRTLPHHNPPDLPRIRWLLRHSHLLITDTRITPHLLGPTCNHLHQCLIPNRLPQCRIPSRLHLCLIPNHLHQCLIPNHLHQYLMPPSNPMHTLLLCIPQEQRIRDILPRQWHLPKRFLPSESIRRAELLRPQTSLRQRDRSTRVHVPS